MSGVEVFVPSTLLSAGMCLVDTPGLGSVFTANTETTQAFIPQIDAALVVIGADPPLAGEELALVEAVSRQAQNLILVLNKADRAAPEERTAAADFARNLLEKRLHRCVGPVFEVSATEHLENRGPERDWKKLAEALERLCRDSGRQILGAACERGVQRLSEQLRVIITEQRAALLRPIEESERRISTLKETINAAERSMRELGFLLLAEQHHLSGSFVGRHKAFLAGALPQAKKEFEEALGAISRGMGPPYRRALMLMAQGIARRQVLPWLQAEQEEAEKEYRRVAARFVEMGNEFLRKLSDAGISELAAMPHALEPEAGFRYRSEFTFRDLIEIAQPASPLRWLADFALSLVGAHRVIRAEAQQLLVRLLESNCTRVQSDILNRVQESRSCLEVEIRKLLHEISRTADEALNRARVTQGAGASAVQAELALLDRLESEIACLRARQ